MEASQSPSPSQTQIQSQSHDIELGLKSLTLCYPINDQKLHHNSCIMASSLMSPPPSPARSHFGDYIGTESCVDMKRCEEEEVQMMTMDVNNKATTTSCYHDDDVRGKKRDYSRKKKKAREFPPPISLLARTENLSPHMPFVLKRYHTNDGRLILIEERVRHYEYFRVQRSNGHLTLQLVLLDDDDDDCDDDDDDDDELFFPFDDENENEHQHAQKPGMEAEAEANFVVEEEEEIGGTINEILEACTDNEGIDIGGGSGGGGGTGNGGGGAMCLNFNNVIIGSSCYLGLPVPAIKPVHT